MSVYSSAVSFTHTFGIISPYSLNGIFLSLLRAPLLFSSVHFLLSAGILLKVRNSSVSISAVHVLPASRCRFTQFFIKWICRLSCFSSALSSAPSASRAAHAGQYWPSSSHNSAPDRTPADTYASNTSRGDCRASGSTATIRKRMGRVRAWYAIHSESRSLSSFMRRQPDIPFGGAAPPEPTTGGPAPEAEWGGREGDDVRRTERNWRIIGSKRRGMHLKNKGVLVERRGRRGREVARVAPEPCMSSS
mmetsp:Transcript_43983/g.86263  ORF Transcript_43983/g.86263 Transcript_43983/m.86263 type:complete len:248 (-) Transcript_43983:85-828(-)